MTPEELRHDEATRWLAQATKDLRAGRVLVAVEPSRSVFHSQQAAEKAAKAFLAIHNMPFRGTHDMKELGQQCAALNPALAPLLAETAVLTDYAVTFRYPDAPREPDGKEAADAIQIAQRLFDEVSAFLKRRQSR
ncbi:MAG: HEPN domain-containing protein [Bryobacteraceae bacterium]